MLITDNKELVRQQCRLYRQQGLSISLVPTTHNVHDGQLHLVDEACRQADIALVVLCVAPQPPDAVEGQAHYPLSLQQDYEKLSQHGAKLVYTPSPRTLYPRGIARQSYLEMPGDAGVLAAAAPPGYFRTIVTLVCKLFNLIVPDSACFGEKDYQQLHVIRQMASDLDYDVDIIGVPTVRDAQGLALSTRHRRLDEAQRAIAPGLYCTLNQLASRLVAGEQDRPTASQWARERLNALGFQRPEVHICDADSLMPLTEASQRAVLLATAWLGPVRLLDNVRINLPAQVGKAS